MFAERGERDNLLAAGSHHAQAPGGNLHGPVAFVDHAVVDGYFRGVFGQRDGEDLAQVPGRGRGGVQADAVGEELVRHRRVVEVIADVPLRSDPEPVTAADLPLRLAAAAELLGVVFKDIVAARGPVRDDAGADVEGDDQFGVSVAD